MSQHTETTSKEAARLYREQEQRDKLVAHRVQVLKNSDLPDQLAGSLAVLLDPATQFTQAEREAAIIDNVLHLVAQRDIELGR